MAAKVSAKCNEIQDFSAYFKEAETACLEKIAQDKALYVEYFSSGMSLDDFAKTKGIVEGTLRYIMRRYDLPLAPIDHSAIKAAKRKAHRQLSVYLANKCECPSAKLLRQVLTEEKRYVE